jgi:hypothetical protein
MTVNLYELNFGNNFKGPISGKFELLQPRGFYPELRLRSYLGTGPAA